MKSLFFISSLGIPIQISFGGEGNKYKFYDPCLQNGLHETKINCIKNEDASDKNKITVKEKESKTRRNDEHMAESNDKSNHDNGLHETKINCIKNEDASHKNKIITVKEKESKTRRNDDLVELKNIGQASKENADLDLNFTLFLLKAWYHKIYLLDGSFLKDLSGQFNKSRFQVIKDLGGVADWSNPKDTGFKTAMDKFNLINNGPNSDENYGKEVSMAINIHHIKLGYLNSSLEDVTLLEVHQNNIVKLNNISKNAVSGKNDYGNFICSYKETQKDILELHYLNSLEKLLADKYKDKCSEFDKKNETSLEFVAFNANLLNTHRELISTFYKGAEVRKMIGNDYNHFMRFLGL